MKARFLPILLFSFAPLIAQEANVAPAEQPALTANQQAFLNMPEERRNEFIKHVQEAMRLFQQKRIFETLDEVAKAEKIFDQSPEVMNLRGSCYVEMRAFDKALEVYEKAVELAPNNPSVEFNIAEVLFVTKEWQKSHDRFTKILDQIPPSNTPLSRLVEFKIMLCKKKLGLKEEAEILAEKYDFLDDSPFHYYAKAALAYDDGDLIKAEEWLAICGRIFRDPAVLAPWQDTLVEFGYIKSFYGEDAAAE